MVATDDRHQTTDHRAKSLIGKSIGISLLLHVGLLGLLLFGLPGDIEKPAGHGESEIISVAIIGASVAPSAGKARGASPSRPLRGLDLPNSGSANRVGGEGGTSAILQQIRNKIERNKYYPLIAKRSRIEGSPLIEFKIKNDGSVEYVILKQSSGSTILDEAAAATVHQAAPYPFYPEPIALNIHYTLAR